MGNGELELAPGGVRNGLKFGGMAPAGGGIEVGVLEAGGITMELEAGIEAESPLLGTTELGGARGEAPGEEHLRGCEAALA